MDNFHTKFPPIVSPLLPDMDELLLPPPLLDTLDPDALDPDELELEELLQASQLGNSASTLEVSGGCGTMPTACQQAAMHQDY